MGEGVKEAPFFFTPLTHSPPHPLIGNCPWSVVEARDCAKVVGQVQLLAGTLPGPDSRRAFFVGPSIRYFPY